MSGFRGSDSVIRTLSLSLISVLLCTGCLLRLVVSIEAKIAQGETSMAVLLQQKTQGRP